MYAVQYYLTIHLNIERSVLIYNIMILTFILKLDYILVASFISFGVMYGKSYWNFLVNDFDKTDLK